MEPYSGGDSLVLWHTTRTGAEGDAQTDPVVSVGGKRSGTRAGFLAFLASESLAGLRVHWISPACGLGAAAIQAVGADAIGFAAPNGATGEPVEILTGETKQLQDARDASKFAIVERAGTLDFVGRTLLDLRNQWRTTVLGGTARRTEVEQAEYQRTHALFVRNESGELLTDVRIWAPALVRDLTDPNVTERLDLGYPNIAAGDQVAIPDTSYWHPHTNFMQVRLVSDGSLVGINYGRLVAGGFHVGHLNMHGLGNPAPTADPVHVLPWAGVRIAFETPAGSPPALTDVLDESLAPPGGLSWNYGYNADTALVPAFGGAYAPGEWPAGESLGLWLHFLCMGGTTMGVEWCDLLASPLVPAVLAWQYTIDGVTYTQTGYGFSRRRRKNTSTGRYYLTEGEGDRVMFPPAGSTQSFPITIALSPDAVTKVEVVRINIYNMETLLGSKIYDLSGGSIVLPDPSAPVDLQLRQDGNDVIVTAAYFPGADGDAAADEWWVRAIQSGGGEDLRSFTVSGDQIALLNATMGLSHWTNSDPVLVSVWVKRTSDGRTSETVSGACIFDATEPEAPVLESFVNERKANV